MHPDRAGMFQLGSRGLSFFPPSNTTSHARTEGWAGAQGPAEHKRQATQYLQSLVLGKEGKEGGKDGFFPLIFVPLLPMARGFAPWEVLGSTQRSVLEGAGRCREAAGRAGPQGEEQKKTSSLAYVG